MQVSTVINEFEGQYGKDYRVGSIKGNSGSLAVWATLFPSGLVYVGTAPSWDGWSSAVWGIAYSSSSHPNSEVGMLPGFAD